MNDIEKAIEAITHQRDDAGTVVNADICNTAISALEKQIPKLAEYIEPFTEAGKFICPSCGEKYDPVYDEETGEPSLWFNHCPECGQAVKTKDEAY